MGEASLKDKSLVLETVLIMDFRPSSMTIIGNDDFLVLNRNEGKVFRYTGGNLFSEILDVNVATRSNRGMLGICSMKIKDVQYVFLYFTEGKNGDGEDERIQDFNPLGNRLYRYELVNNELVHPKLILNLPAVPGPRHAGGAIDSGPDGNIYLTIGDSDGTFRDSKYQTMAQNYLNGSDPDGRAGLLWVKPDGGYVDESILGDVYPLNLYYAYGIRNSFGFDWDPITGKL